MRFDLDLLPEDTKPYFRDVYDHAMRINEMADTLREVLATALDANLSVISVSQNKDTKRLAAWAAIIAAPTAIAGIYGMNFQYMPELGWRYGYERSSWVWLQCAAGCGWGSSGLVGCRQNIAGQRITPLRTLCRVKHPASCGRDSWLKEPEESEHDFSKHRKAPAAPAA